MNISNDEYESQYQKVSKNKLSNTLIRLDYSMKQEIFSKFPKLTHEEYEERIKVAKTKRKDNLTTFYNKIKKNYPSFVELNTIQDVNLIHDLYSLYYDYEENKHNLQYRQFQLSSYIMQEIGRSVYEDFADKIYYKFDKINSQAMKNEEEFWLNAMIDTKYRDISLPNLNYIIKYDPNLHTNLLIITVECIYDGLDNEIFILLTSRPRLKKVILKFGKKTYLTQMKKIVDYVDEDQWVLDCNLIVNLFLSTLHKNNFSDLYSLVIGTMEGGMIPLDSINTYLLSDVLLKYKFEVFVSLRFKYDKASEWKLIDSIKKMPKIKLVIFVEAELNEDLISPLPKYFDSKNKDDLVYLRFSETVRYSGLV